MDFQSFRLSLKDHVLYFLWYAALGGTALVLMHVFGWGFFLLTASAATLVYFALHHLLIWTMPRRRRHAPGLVLCFLGSFVVSLAVRDQLVAAGWADDAVDWVAVLSSVRQSLWLHLVPFAGAFMFFYVGVKSGTPQNCTMVVRCDAVSEPHGNDPVLITHMKRLNTGVYSILDRLFFHRTRNLLDFTPAELNAMSPPGPKGPPWVWPYEYVVGREGTLTWHVYGQQGHLVVITLENRRVRGVSLGARIMGARTRKYNPFHPVATTTRSRILPPAEEQPLILSAGPAVRAGRGGYTIAVYRNGVQSDANLISIVDPGGSGPRKD